MKKEEKIEDVMGMYTPQMQQPQIQQPNMMQQMPQMPQMQQPNMMQQMPQMQQPNMMPQMMPTQQPMMCCPYLMNMQCPMNQGMSGMGPMQGNRYNMMDPYTYYNPMMGMQY